MYKFFGDQIIESSVHPIKAQQPEEPSDQREWESIHANMKLSQTNILFVTILFQQMDKTENKKIEL
jgi:hypothetical protein